MNKLKDLNLIRKVIILVTLLELLLYSVEYIFKLNIIGEINNISHIISPMTFGFLMLSYSYYFDNTFKGIVFMLLSVVVNGLTNLISGNDLNTSIDMLGADLPLVVLGMIIMVVVGMYKDSKNKTKTKLVDAFCTPNKTKLLYKAMAYCTIFTVFTHIYNNFDFNTITDTSLKSLLTLQSILPTFIILAYITLTDIGYPIIILYNIVYTVASVLVIEYVGVNIILIINMILFMIVSGYLVQKHKEYKSKNERKKKDE